MSEFESRMIVHQAHIDLFNRYCDILDRKDWPKLRSLFTDNATFRASPPNNKSDHAPDIVAEGGDNVASIISEVLETVSATHHTASNHIVEVAPDGKTAHASVYSRCYHAGKGAKADLFEESLARFELDTIFDGSEWKVRHMHETILIMLGTNVVFG